MLFWLILWLKLFRRYDSLCRNLENSNNWEIEWILKHISGELEKTTVGILNSINVDLDRSDVETCHRIDKSKDGKSNKTITGVVNYKFCKKALLNRKKMLLVVTNNNEIQLKNKVFINENQTDYNNEIASYYRKLKKAPLVGNTFWEMEWYILSLRMDEEIRLFAPWVKKYYCLSRFIYWRSNVIDLFHVALLFTSLQGQINK